MTKTNNTAKVRGAQQLFIQSSGSIALSNLPTTPHRKHKTISTMTARKLHLYIFSLLGLLAFATICSVVKFTFLGVNETSSHRELTALLGLWSHPQHTPFSYKAFSSPDDVFADEHLSAMTADHPKDLVVVFVDKDYLETFGVWLDHYKQHDNSHRVLCVIAISEYAYEKLDQVFTLPTAQDAFSDLGETVLVNFLPGQHANQRVVTYLWVERLNFMRRIINAYPALNVLYSDADAIWLKDPAQLYNHAQHLSSDVVASRGTYPGECPLGREANGEAATVCFGFTYFRNSAALRTLALNMQNNVQNYSGDDQMTINCVLNDGWIPNGSINIEDPSSMASFTLSDGSIIRSFHHHKNVGGAAPNIQVSVLPYHQVMRRCDLAPSLDGVVVAHCYTTAKHGSQKMQMFAKYGFLTRGESSIRHLFGETFQNQLAAAAAPPPPPSTASMKEAAYNLAMERFWRRIKNNNLLYYPDLVSQYQSNGGALMRNTRVLNSIRIPKSGSSALSATARALAGCHPDGYPCCNFPGDPEGSCPRKDLMCPLVTGCTDHRPNYSGDETVITSLRNPIKRSVSAFFYAPPHTSVEVGQAHTWEKFVENIQSPKYRNILTKMLNGAYAYDNFDASRHTVPNAKARLCSIAWFGLSEMPVASHMMLYETVDFRQLEPNPITFGLPAKDAVLTEEVEKVEKVDGLRVNGDSEYKNFLSTSFQSNNGASLVADQNKEDVEVFQFAEVLFCGRFLAKLGLVDEMRQISLGVEEIERCANLLGGRGNVEQLC